MASWSIFILFIIVNSKLRSVGAPIIADLVSFSLVVSGFVLACVGLFGVARHGRKGILIPAIVGLILNGLFILVGLTNLLAAIQRARTHV